MRLMLVLGERCYPVRLLSADRLKEGLKGGLQGRSTDPSLARVGDGAGSRQQPLLPRRRRDQHHACTLPKNTEGLAR